MILDPDGWGLAQEIEQLLADLPAELEGQVKPELFQAVLEIATRPCDDVPCAGRELVALREAVIGVTAREGLAIGAAATHPFALCADQEIVDRPRYRELIDELGLDRAARADLRHPRPRRDRGRRPGDLRRRRHPPLPAAVPGALGQLAVLGGPADRPDVVAGAGLPLLSPRGHPAPLRHLGDLLPPGRDDDARRRDRGLHVPVVGRAAASEPGHGRDPDLRPADAGRAHDLARGAGRVARPPALLSLRRGRAAGRVPDRAHRRQQGPRRAPRHRRPADRLPRRRAGAGPGDGPRAGRAARAARRGARLRRRARRGRGAAHRRHRRSPPARDRRRATARTCAPSRRRSPRRRSRSAPAAVGNT